MRLGKTQRKPPPAFRHRERPWTPAPSGGVAEWLNAAVSKTVSPVTPVTRVRIPPPPPETAKRPAIRGAFLLRDAVRCPRASDDTTQQDASRGTAASSTLSQRVTLLKPPRRTVARSDYSRRDVLRSDDSRHGVLRCRMFHVKHSYVDDEQLDGRTCSNPPKTSPSQAPPFPDLLSMPPRVTHVIATRCATLRLGPSLFAVARSRIATSALRFAPPSAARRTSSSRTAHFTESPSTPILRRSVLRRRMFHVKHSYVEKQGADGPGARLRLPWPLLYASRPRVPSETRGLLFLRRLGYC